MIMRGKMMMNVEYSFVPDGECEICGDPNGYSCLEPYALEIGGEEVEVIYCDSCYTDSANDI